MEDSIDKIQPQLGIDEIKEQIEEAIAFFTNDEPLENAVIKGVTGIRKGGLFSVICSVELQSDPIVRTKLNEMKKGLLLLSSLFAYKVKVRSDLNDMSEWNRVIDSLPLLKLYQYENLKFSTRLKGNEIPARITEFLLDIKGRKDSNTNTNDFANYLQNVGDELRKGIKDNISCRSLIVANTVEVKKVGNAITYIPKIKLFSSNFDNNNSKWTSLCFSNETIDINFDYTVAIYEINYQAFLSVYDKFKMISAESLEDYPLFFGNDF